MELLKLNIRLIIQFILIIGLIIFSGIFLTFASKHELSQLENTTSSYQISSGSYDISLRAQINYRVDSSSFQIILDFDFPIINSNGGESYANLTEVHVDLKQITKMDLNVTGLDFTKLCSGTQCSELQYSYATIMKSEKSVINSKLSVTTHVILPNQENKVIQLTTKSITYLKETALLEGIGVMIILYLVLGVISFYKPKLEFPEIQKDEHFQLSSLFSEVIRKRIILKLGMLLLFFGFIIWEHNPQLFDTKRWYSSDIVYFSSFDFNGLEFSLMILIYLFVEFLYLSVVYWRDNDLRQWISFIDNKQELKLSINRLFVHPLYAILFPILLAYAYHNPCSDCASVSGIQPRSGDYVTMIDLLRIEVGFFIILLYTQYAKTRAK